MRTKISYLVLFSFILSSFLISCRDYDLETLRQVVQMYKVEGAEFVGTETCEMCHEDQVEHFKRSSHERITIPGENFVVEGCEMCHGPGSLHVDADGGKGVHIINPKKDPTVCFVCHQDKKTEFNLPYHHPVPEGHMSCTDCHNIHGEEDRKWALTSMESVDEKCYECHKDKQGPFVFEHEAMKEGCTSCHQVHGSINKKMLTVRDNIMCLKCHAQGNFPVMGRFNHGGFITEGSCSNAGCHPTAHRASHTGLTAAGINCLDCHDLHGAGVGGALLIKHNNNKCLVCHTLPAVAGGRNHSFLARGSCFSSGCHTAVHGSNFDQHLRD